MIGTMSVGSLKTRVDQLEVKAWEAEEAWLETLTDDQLAELAGDSLSEHGAVFEVMTDAELELLLSVPPRLASWFLEQMAAKYAVDLDGER